METCFNIIAFSVLTAVPITLIWNKSQSSHKKLQPPSPWKLPIIGHLHHLSGAPPHHSLRKVSQKYGPLFHLQLGEIPAIVVSSPRFAKEVMRTQDLTFANRALFLAGKIMCYDYADIVFAPYGEYWREMRKICSSELLSPKSVRSYVSIRQEEASNLIRSIQNAAIGNSTPINLTEKLAEYTSSMVVRAAFGRVSKDDQNAFLELVQEAWPYTSSFEVSDLFPSMKILHHFLSIENELMKIHHKLDQVLDNIINDYLEENLARSEASSSSVEQGNEDLIDVLLRVKEDKDLPIRITMENIKAVLIDVFTGGTETSSSTVEWAMAEMIRHPEVLAKAQEEIRTAFMEKEVIEEAGIQELKYLKLVVKETLRLHPPVPLLVPRESREQTEIDGYIINLSLFSGQLEETPSTGTIQSVSNRRDSKIVTKISLEITSSLYHLAREEGCAQVYLLVLLMCIFH
ncbi:OLC1v1030464C1 [Oldenlandia corymbosa var. corymbosa]|uniref:OLC1v1030464C1 n=1 Tax=Oldenlandia corymbosa var. corymbosa TaxID=529605 RepID=A0AAV1CH58_OLDCO|nr:OLC1v1030464C1 [Oldenlandia corymbosa var. corymbosa]